MHGTSRSWLAVVLLLISTPARATTLSDRGNGFLDFSCSSAPTAFDCARYPYSSGGPLPVTAEARVDSLGGVDAEFFDQGVFGIFFLPGAGLTALDPYTLLLPEVTTAPPSPTRFRRTAIRTASATPAIRSRRGARRATGPSGRMAVWRSARSRRTRRAR